LANPGFTGPSGKLLKITFKALKPGDAPITFDSADILSNDGSGTDVTSKLNSATVAIADSDPTPEPATGPVDAKPVILASTGDNVGNIPKTPVVSSREIPSESEWYKLDTATFRWTLPSDIISVQTGIDTNIDGVPTKTFTPAISSRTAIQLDDGTAYFHVRFKNSAGWSSVASYKINIDNQPPKDFQVSGELTAEGLTKLLLKASDATSGLSQFSIMVDGNQVATIDADNGIEKSKILPVFAAGKHTAVVRVYDKAKNYLEKSISFVSPELKNPVIISYPAEVQNGDKITLLGKAHYPNTLVKVYLIEDESEPISYSVQSDADGLFKFESGKVSARKLVAVYAETNLSDNVTKLPSEKVFVKISKSLLSVLLSRIIEFTSAFVPLVGMLLLLAFFFYVFFMRLKIKQAKLRSDLHDAEMELHTEFVAIQNNIDAYVKTLSKTSKKRDLTKEETKMLKEFSKVLTRIEKVVNLKIKNIEDKDL
jgi:hypothetical protein